MNKFVIMAAPWLDKWHWTNNLMKRIDLCPITQMNRRPGLWGIDLSSNNVQMNFRSICLDECSAASVSAVDCCCGLLVD